MYAIARICILSLLVSTAVSAEAIRAPGWPTAKVLSGMEEFTHGPQRQSTTRIPHHSLDLTGTAYEAGTTWYDYQHNGTVGRMIDVDELGFVHVVWMNGLNESLSQRHVYYNVWDPVTESFLIGEGGGLVDAATRAGYVTQVVTEDGFCFPAFHQFLPTGQFRTVLAFDFLPRAGAFTSFMPTVGDLGDVGWAKIGMSGNGDLHVVSTVNAWPDTTYGYYYSRGTPLGGEIEWQSYGTSDVYEIGDGAVIAANVAASRISARVAILWHQSRGGIGGFGQVNNNLLLAVSEDGGMTWAEPIDVTQWAEPDFECESGDTTECNRDTLRVYVCNSVLFDENDVIHVAFTTKVVYEFSIPDGSGPGTNMNMSGIWHWDEAFGEYAPIANAYYYATANGDTLEDCAWQTLVQRPSLACDTVTGDLYCSYMQYDSTQWSWAGWMMADAWITKSENGGRSWKQGVNVTETDGGQNTPVGASLHERDVCLAPLVTHSDGEALLHMQYVLDLDAGSAPHSEGFATECPVYYQSIPVSDLEFEEDLDPFWPTMHVDSSGMPGRVIPIGQCPVPENLSMIYDDELELLRLFWQRPEHDCPCYRVWYTDLDEALFPEQFVIQEYALTDTFAAITIGGATHRAYVVQGIPCP